MLHSIGENGADSSGSEDDNNNDTDQLESWARIQQNTFLNWINDKLRVYDITCTNLKGDLKDGVALCRLMKVLRNADVGRVRIKKRMSQIESSGNLALALQAMKQDGVKLVNIGPSDIAGGNVKLNLGLMWSLIRHYQIGSQSKLPAKKLMLSWINAILHPHRHVTNFNTDWNDGVALHGVIEFCKPGTFPDWHTMNASDGLANCHSGLQAAHSVLDIPLVVTAQNFSSRDLDELSGMTYLSYFMSEGSPGYKATLNWVKSQVSTVPVDNFDKDWNNGYVLSSLIHALGGVIPGWPNFNTADWVGTLTIAIDVSQSQLGVEPVLSARDMVQETVDHIGVMAYAAWHIPVAPPPDPPVPSFIPAPPLIIPPTPSPPPEPEPEPEPEVVEPESPPPPSVPLEIIAIPPVQVQPPPEVKDYVRISKQWQINALQTIVVNAESLGKIQVKASAISPDGRNINLTVSQPDEFIHYVSFLPTAKGPWHVDLKYIKDIQEKSLESSPSVVHVYDVRDVILQRNVEKTTLALGSEYHFTVQCADSGLTEVDAFVLYDGETMEHKIRALPDGTSFDICFSGAELGKYTAAVFAGGLQLTGSPFDLQCKDLSHIKIKGSGLYRAEIGRDTNFLVDYSDGEFGHVSVHMTSPSGEAVLPAVRVKDTGIAEVTYNPPIPGDYKMCVYYDGLLVGDGEYTIQVGNKKVCIREIKAVSYVGVVDQFIVDASAAGKGQLEIDSDLPIREYNTISERVYSITYVPKRTGSHDLTVKYNSIVVQGCPCTVDVHAASQDTPNGDVSPTGSTGSIEGLKCAESGEVT